MPSHFRYGPPDDIVATRRTKHSRPSWYSPPGLGHSTGLGYVALTLREITGLSQSKLADRSRTTQPAIARLESGRQLPSVATLVRLANACGLHLVVGLADPALDADDLCMHDLTLLGVLVPSDDGLVDFVVVREPPPWVGGG